MEVPLNESNQEPPVEDGKTLEEKAKLHVWPEFTRPPYMTDVHALVLKEIWPEVKYPTQLREELNSMFPDIKPHEARNIVAHWLWTENYVTPQGKTP